MDKKTLATVFTGTVMLAGCGGMSWLPWSSSSGEEGAPRTPPGAKGYACEGGKRLLVRYAPDTKSVMVIYANGEFRLDRVASASGEQFSNGPTILAIRDGEAMMEESGTVQFAKCKPESAP